MKLDSCRRVANSYKTDPNGLENNSNIRNLARNNNNGGNTNNTHGSDNGSNTNSLLAKGSSNIKEDISSLKAKRVNSANGA